MHNLLILILMITTLFARESESSMQIPSKMCLNAKYAHTLGGTLHSRSQLKKRLIAKSEATLPYTRTQALHRLQKEYPAFEITNISFLIRNCKGYYRFRSSGRDYYVDPLTLKIIKGERS